MADPVRIALQNLVDRLTEVEASPEFQNVWVIAHIHGFEYTGPNYAKELEAAREALK